MMKHKLLSIGEVSDITGVHINSLRYYDKLGILKPAYIDPDTNYRYYANSQIGVIEAIQACVEMDIPLKQYLDFTDNNGQTIHAQQLLEYGKVQAEKKIKAIRAGMKRIELLQKEMEHSNMLQNANQPIIYDVPKKKYYVIPMQAPLTEDEYINLDRLCFVAAEQGYATGQELGLLYFFNTDNVQRYQFIEITSGIKKKDSSIITIPAGRFMAKVVKADTIENASQEFPEQFAQAQTKVVIETELFTGNADVDNPLYELRCLMPELKM